MVKLDCIYHSFENEGAGVYSQCERHLQGLCPCEECNSYISIDEMKRCVEILRQIRKESNHDVHSKSKILFRVF